MSQESGWTRPWKVVAWGAGLLLLAVITIVTWWLVSALQVQKSYSAIKIPTPRMPSPNAFDIYVKAASAIRYADKIDHSTDFLDQQRANTNPPAREYSLVEKQALVTANANSLAELRPGFAHECRTPPCRSMNEQYPYLKQFRRMGRLFALEAEVRAGRGDWTGSIDSCLDAVRFGEDLPRGGPLIHKLVGLAVQNIGRRPAWKAIDHLRAEEARVAARRMESISRTHVSIAETLIEEKWFGLGYLRDLGNTKAQVSPEESEAWANCPGFIKRLTLSRYATRMDEQIAITRKVYAARPRTPDEPRRSLNPLLMMPDTFCAIMLPVGGRAWLTDLRGLTQNALLEIALALRAYRLDHGRYPTALKELTPHYISRIPDDLFALKGPLRYRLVADNYVLYSVGPDAKDNGGNAIDNPKANANLRGLPERMRRFGIQEDSKGDIVAGVNIY